MRQIPSDGSESCALRSHDFQPLPALTETNVVLDVKLDTNPESNAIVFRHVRNNPIEVFSKLTKDDVIFSKQRVVVGYDEGEEKKVPMYLRINHVKYTNPSILDTGTFGVVLKYSIDYDENIRIDDNLKDVCVKVRRNSKDDLSTDLVFLKKHLRHNDVLKRIVVPGVVRSGKIIMPILFNNIQKLIELPDDDERDETTIKRVYDFRTKILKILSHHIFDLYSAGYYYTDMKLDNILYYYVDGELHLMLCDPGSVFTASDSAIYTYYSPERAQKEKGTKHDNPVESDLVWGLGNIICELLEIDAIFDRKELPDDWTQIIEKTLNNLKETYPNWNDLYDKIFVEHDKRVSLKGLCEMIDKI